MSNAAHSLPREGCCSAISFHSLRPSLLPHLVTLLAQGDRTTCTSFCRDGHILSTLGIAHVQSPTTLACTRDEALLLPLFLIVQPNSLGVRRQSCVSADSTRITLLRFGGGAVAWLKDLCSSSASLGCSSTSHKRKSPSISEPRPLQTATVSYVP